MLSIQNKEYMKKVQEKNISSALNLVLKQMLIYLVLSMGKKT